MKFINLHQHTTYSFLDGYGIPSQVADRLREIQQDGCAITDHGNIYGHVPFSKTFKKAGKHLVYGCEFYAVQELKKERGYFHVTVLAKDNGGYQNLLKLVNLSNQQFYYKPRISFQQLSDLSKGLIILSGCFNDGWLFKNPAGWEQWLQWFEKTEWYLELQPFTDLKNHWELLTNLVIKHGLKAVVTFDSHYPAPEDKESQDFMLAINTNRPLSDPDRLKMDFPLWMPTCEEAVQRCKEVGAYKEEWLTLSHDIAMSCQVSLPKTSIVKLDIPTSKIEQMCRKAMPDWMKTNTEYQSRLSYEFKMIEEKEFADYFYIIADLMKWAKKHMLCGPGRGSSAGSLVCYLLGITEIDPIKMGLLFERFIDVNRKDLPDIDLDFPASRRDEVIKYLKKKYGKTKTMQLVTFNTFKPKAILQDAARVLRIPAWKVKEATSQIIKRGGGDSRSDFCLEDSLHQYEKLNALFKEYPDLKKTLKLEGQIRQIGKHAAAVAIAQDDFSTIAAIKEDIISIDKYSADEVGLLKIDILGLETLDIIMDICNEVGIDFQSFYTLPLDDTLTFERVFTPAKVKGIFQFEGLSVMTVCKDLNPTNFNQLVHITALGRPGPLNCGSTKQYIKRFRGEQYSIDPILAPYLSDTLGVVMYQEQVMRIVKNVGAFSWDDTSIIRKAMSKSLGEEFINKYRAEFVKGATSQGIDKDKANKIFDQIYTFGSWAFNLSHAASYALVSYWMGYCKAHWPAQFYARILKNKIEEEEIIPILKEYGSDFVPIDLNKSKLHFSAQGDKLYGGFTNIKGIGEKAAARILAMQPFESNEDFKSRIPKGIAAKVLDALENGLSWSSFKTLEEQVDMSKIELSVPISALEYIKEEMPYNTEAIALGKVVHVNLKDHNEEEKVQKRGFKMQGWTEYVVLKMQDENFNIYHICFDRHYTEKHKQTLLSTKGKICLVKVIKMDNNLNLGKKVKILESKVK